MQDQPYQPEETQDIPLRLEQYDDIFSDFDMRPYSKRALSVDFLDEIKRAARDKDEEGLELNLYMPEKGRNPSHEATIKERLAEHFKRHFHLILKEKRDVLNRGLWMAIMGIICMVAGTLIVFNDPHESLFLSFLLVFLEPAALFLLWEGMEEIIFNSKKLNPELHFYRKMSGPHRHINFMSY